jgi:hypothetical protein
MKYTKFSYIYPTRPKNAICPDDLDFYDNGSLLGQIKGNGSNCEIYTNGDKVVVMNRHNQRLTNFRLTDEEVKSLYHGNGEWLVINGEYLNKNKLDETNKPFNHKFIIYDILVYNDEHLIGKTFEERIHLLDYLYGKVDSEKEYLYRISENVYRFKSYGSGFKELFDKLTPIDLVEGLVLKRKNSKLEAGLTSENNWRSQIKCRKKTLSYKY